MENDELVTIQMDGCSFQEVGPLIPIENAEDAKSVPGSASNLTPARGLTDIVITPPDEEPPESFPELVVKLGAIVHYHVITGSKPRLAMIVHVNGDGTCNLSVAGWASFDPVKGYRDNVRFVPGNPILDVEKEPDSPCWTWPADE